MKNFKLKLFSLVLCTFMLLSVFTGCSLFVSNDGKDKNKVELVIGEEKITREELSQLYYSFYSQNSSYFYYYGEEQIVDIFYRSVIASKLTLQEAKKLIANNTIVSGINISVGGTKTFGKMFLTISTIRLQLLKKQS